jgi:hypothetical protein
MHVEEFLKVAMCAQVVQVRAGWRMFQKALCTTLSLSLSLSLSLKGIVADTIVDWLQ